MKKIYSIILTLSIMIGLTTTTTVDATEGEVCKQETHWYYFSLADHSDLATIESAAQNVTYSTTFSNSTWPENAKIESVTTYKGFTKEDIAMWYDLYVVSRVPVYTDGNGEVHHVHDFLYTNHDINKSSTNNVDDATRANYDVLGSDEARATFRNNYIENVYNAQIIPTEANITINQGADGVVNGEINRTYGGMSLSSVVPYNYVVDPANPELTNNVFLISAKAKVVLSYDCEVPVVEEPEEPKEPVVEQPVEEPVEPEQPLVEEPNPNTGDLGLILSSVMAVGASGTGIYAYRKRKSL